ncbi:MAG: hypothetical protein J6Q21_04835 [Alistipes sp.]|nr:hypothetical protein [Alistipes sp.]
MIEFKHSLETAERWKMAVKSLWKTQRMILIFGILTGVVMLGVAITLMSGVLAIDDAEELSVVLIVIACILGFVGICLSIVTYIYQWVFYFDLKRWGELAPRSLAGNIRTLATCSLVTLITGIVASFFDLFSAIPYVGIVTAIISALVGLCSLVFEIIKFVMFIRLKNAPDMPHMAKVGTKNIFWSYIVTFATVILSAIFLFSSAVALFAVILNEEEATYSEYEYDYDDEYDYYYEDDYYEDDVAVAVAVEESNSGSLLAGIKNLSDIDDEDVEELEEFFDNATASTIAIVLFLIGILTFLIGCIASVILYYYGWWLISKSELETLPERSTTESIDNYIIEE